MAGPSSSPLDQTQTLNHHRAAGPFPHFQGARQEGIIPPFGGLKGEKGGGKKGGSFHKPSSLDRNCGKTLINGAAIEEMREAMIPQQRQKESMFGGGMGTVKPLQKPFISKFPSSSPLARHCKTINLPPSSLLLFHSSSREKKRAKKKSSMFLFL
jgi:hypothetical protein